MRPDPYSVSIRPQARRSLRQLDPAVRKTLVQIIDGLAANPRPVGVRLLTGHRPYLRIRSSDCRIVYAVDDQVRAVIVAAVGHRREIYRGLDL